MFTFLFCRWGRSPPSSPCSPRLCRMLFCR